MVQEFWVFGYGSLMWRPGFEFVERHQALLRGMHRGLCIYSHVHRGTPDRPGLVMGLDRGGACRGIAFRVEPGRWHDTVAYLRAREQVTMVYLERTVNVELRIRPARQVTALTYIVDRDHPQYAGKLSLEDQLTFIRQGHGKAGPCHEYVISINEHIREMGMRDGTMESLCADLP
ncbi:MAG: gamma-glutamylcyclotransferase [Aestuariivirgaceae bacterium]